MPLTKVSNSMIVGATINPDDLGADPTGVADSSAAIQAAIDTGKTVLFSNGANYKITSGIVCDNNNQVIDGNGATLTPVGAFNAVTINAAGMTFRNMVIIASGLTGTILDLPTEIGGGTFFIEKINTVGGTIGMSMANQYTAYITNCRFSYFTDYGMYLTSTPGFGGINSLWFTGCFFVNGGSAGLPVVFVKAAGGVYFDKCTWQGNNANTIAMQVEAATGLYITNCYVEEYNTLRGFWFYNNYAPGSLQSNAIRDNYFLMDAVPVVFGQNSSTNIQITGNTFQVTPASVGPAVQGMQPGFYPAVYGNLGSRQDIDDTFTPTLAFGGNSVGVAYDVRTGVIRNNGVYLEGGVRIKLTSKGSSTGDATINIPTTMLNAVPNQNADAIVDYGVYFNMAGITALDSGFVDGNAIRMHNASATDADPLTDANFTNTSEIYVSFRTRFVNINQ